jgi:hypothetical protein
MWKSILKIEIKPLVFLRIGGMSKGRLYEHNSLKDPSCVYFYFRDEDKPHASLVTQDRIYKLDGEEQVPYFEDILEMRDWIAKRLSLLSRLRFSVNGIVFVDPPVIAMVMLFKYVWGNFGLKRLQFSYYVSEGEKVWFIR